MKKNITKISSTILFIALIIFIISFINSNANAHSALASGYHFQDFENPQYPPIGWSITNSSGYNWIRTLACSGYGTGTSAIIADFFDYQSGTFDIFTHTVPVTSAGDSLKFDHAYATYQTEVDRLEVYTSINNGSSWVLLVNLLGGPSGPLSTAPGTSNVFVPTASQWATKSYALPTGTNKLKFSGVTAYGNNLYLDNIRIGGTYVNDVGANSIAVPKGPITPGNVVPKATVKNYGSTTQSFSVNMTINPGGYTNTQSVSNLAPGQSQLLTFTNFNFATAGTYTVKAFSTLATDNNRLNDTSIFNVIVTTAPRNVVFEYCTGTWCQWCPCGKQQAALLEQYYPNSIILAYHGSGSDPWINFNGNGIIGMLGFTGYPSGVLDRKGILGWGSFFFNGENRYATAPASPVNITITNQSYNITTRQLNVTLNTTALEALTGQYKINYVITEDNLVYQQSGNGTCVGGPNYVHKWVVRNMVNNAAGENVNTGTWNQNQTYTKSFSTTLDAAWVAANCKLQIFVYKDLGALNMSEVQQGIKTPVNPVGIEPGNSGLPVKYELGQNFPNPFNPVTNVKFSIPKDGIVKMKIYDILGKEVAVYMDGFLKAGEYNAAIDGTNLPSGVYFYNLTAENFSDTKKMVLIK